MDALKVLAAALALAAASPARADPPTDQIARWAPHIAEASARFGVPVAWIERVMRAESGGRTELGGRPIVSSAGAMGLMQLMPGTWAEMRRKLGLGPAPHAPRDNILAGTFYLRLMYDRFGYPGLFGAYNAGPARYAAWASGRGRLPSETRAYLVTVAGHRADGGGGKIVTASATSVAVPPPPDPPNLFFVRRADGMSATATTTRTAAATAARVRRDAGSLFALRRESVPSD